MGGITVFYIYMTISQKSRRHEDDFNSDSERGGLSDLSSPPPPFPTPLKNELPTNCLVLGPTDPLDFDLQAVTPSYV